MRTKKKGDIVVMIGRLLLLLAIMGTLFNIVWMFKGLFTAELGESPFPSNLFILYWPLVLLGYILCIIFINWKDLLNFFGGFGLRLKNFIIYGEFEENIENGY